MSDSYSIILDHNLDEVSVVLHTAGVLTSWYRLDGDARFAWDCFVGAVRVETFK